MEKNIPIIDVGSLTQGAEISPRLVKEIDNACREVGFFTVVNHGVDNTLISTVFSQIESFFDLPVQAKEKIEIHKSPYMRGYFSEGADKSDGILGDVKEGFDMAADLSLDDEFVKAKLPFYGPNVWPGEFTDFQLAMREYHSQMLAFGKNC